MIVALVVGSHGVLDAFGQTTKGVALLWPASSKRLFAPPRVGVDPDPGGLKGSERLLRTRHAPRSVDAPERSGRLSRRRGPISGVDVDTAEWQAAWPEVHAAPQADGLADAAAACEASH